MEKMLTAAHNPIEKGLGEEPVDHKQAGKEQITLYDKQVQEVSRMNGQI